MSPEESTRFAPAERRSPAEVERHWDTIAATPLLGAVMQTIPEGLILLNDCRQIVFANAAFGAIVGCENLRNLAGMRLGEALKCMHSHEARGGCGTTEYCQECGAVHSMMACQAGRADAQECSVNLANGESLDLKVHATPLALEGETLTMVCVVDLSGEKRRRVLERLFFHDVLNTAGGLHGVADLISRRAPPESDQKHLAYMVYTLSNSIIEEIGAQRDLAAAENSDLPVRTENLQSLQALTEVAEAYRHHEAAMGKSIAVEPRSVTSEFRSDPTILRRVLGNLLKNALEASRHGHLITLRCRPDAGRGVIFEVHNPTSMSREVQLQVFKRSFSTKGPGRGVGTYSIRLLTEKYLGGTVAFTSNATDGTTFQLRLPATLGQAAASLKSEASMPEHAEGDLPASLRGARLLLAEDSRISQKIAVKLLTSLGAEVEVVNNGREAIDLLQSLPAPPPFDIVLMDLHMPEMDGIEATVALRADSMLCDLPIVALSGADSPQEIANCLAAGMDAHLTKPYDLGMMFETLRRLYRPAGPGQA